MHNLKPRSTINGKKFKYRYKFCLDKPECRLIQKLFDIEMNG